MEFLKFNASKKLQELAKHPYDLSHLNSDRVAKYAADGGGYQLLYGTERIDDEVMKALEELAKEARVLEKMAKMQAGEVCNRIDGYPSENRRVLHTATRDFFQPNPAPAAKEGGGFGQSRGG